MIGRSSCGTRARTSRYAPEEPHRTAPASGRGPRGAVVRCAFRGVHLGSVAGHSRVRSRPGCRAGEQAATMDSVEDRGYIVDRLTQWWVRATGRLVLISEHPWLGGPIGEPRRIGDAWVQREADRLGAEVHEGGGLVGDFDRSSARASIRASWRLRCSTSTRTPPAGGSTSGRSGRRSPGRSGGRSPPSSPGVSGSSASPFGRSRRPRGWTAGCCRTGACRSSFAPTTGPAERSGSARLSATSVTTGPTCSSPRQTGAEPRSAASRSGTSTG